MRRRTWAARPVARAAEAARSSSAGLSSVTRHPAATARRTSSASFTEPFTEIMLGGVPTASAACSSPGPKVSAPRPSSFRTARSASERFALSDGRSAVSPSGQAAAKAAPIRRALRRS